MIIQVAPSFYSHQRAYKEILPIIYMLPIKFVGLRNGPCRVCRVLGWASEGRKELNGLVPDLMTSSRTPT
jgi:hypothetical protein